MCVHQFPDPLTPQLQRADSDRSSNHGNFPTYPWVQGAGLTVHHIHIMSMLCATTLCDMIAYIHASLAFTLQ